jgi:hypothetical protein
MFGPVTRCVARLRKGFGLLSECFNGQKAQTRRFCLAVSVSSSAAYVLRFGFTVRNLFRADCSGSQEAQHVSSGSMLLDWCSGATAVGRSAFSHCDASRNQARRLGFCDLPRNCVVLRQMFGIYSKQSDCVPDALKVTGIASRFGKVK